jgi:hypothetical protein
MFNVRHDIAPLGSHLNIQEVRANGEWPRANGIYQNPEASEWHIIKSSVCSPQSAVCPFSQLLNSH